MSAEESEAAYEKFAELIVQKCISVINTKAAEVPVEDEYERMWKMGTEFAVYQIGKHFGVEE
jgi:exo-beta-1,3-glucanase (GH17 family)